MGHYDKYKAERQEAGIDRLQKYNTIEEIKLLCKTFNCDDIEALTKDDTYLTLLLCYNIEKSIFDVRFSDIMEAKHKK